ncbi:MAG: bifunctional chorismate mutase/prephenate dehydratase [Eubacteriales bacterium]
MDELEKARKEINEADRDMAELFCKRMNAVRAVADYKKKRGLPVLDKEREEAVIVKNSASVEDDELRAYYVNFLKYTMELSRSFQHKLISGARIAYTGIAGAFASVAAECLFPDAEHIAYGDFEAAYKSVENGECDSVVLPIENSYAGEVGQVMDLIFSGTLYINNVANLAVTQNLLGVPGSRIEDITEVISHPQAIAQSAKFISKHGFTSTPFSNTALAAKHVSELGKKNVAAIAGDEAAKLYGLTVLAHGINESNTNTTRFATLSRVESRRTGRPDDNFMLVFTVKNEAGSLAEAINIIGKYGYNMRNLHSRPMKSLMWQYYFYVEAEGDIRNANGENMMRELLTICDKLKLVGSYSVK